MSYCWRTYFHAIQPRLLRGILQGNRSGSENLTLAIPSPYGVSCRHGNTGCPPTGHLGMHTTRSQAYIGAFEARVAALVAMVQALQEQLHQTSRNSSRPPSSDPPLPQRPHRPRGKRRRGGQPGHPGSTRTLIPVEEVDEAVVIKPAQCTHYPASLSGDDPQSWRHQVIELPPIKPVVTEYHWHQLACPACGETTRAPWPAGVPAGHIAPACRRRSRCARGRIACPSARRSR